MSLKIIVTKFSLLFKKFSIFLFFNILENSLKFKIFVGVFMFVNKNKKIIILISMKLSFFVFNSLI